MTAPVAMTHCPTEETLAAFIDDRLDRDARQRVIEHMVNCGDCRDVILTVPELLAAEETTGASTAPERGVSITRFTPRATFNAAAVLAAAAVLIVVFGPMVRERVLGRSEMQQLVEASESSPTRPLEGRLSGGFPYREEWRAKRGTSKEDPDEYRLDLISDRLAAGAQRSPTPANLHALAASQLYRHDYERALETLVRALTIETGEDELLPAIKKCRDAKLLTDLAAVLLRPVPDEATRSNNRTLAHEAAQRAWGLDETEETAWNRALAIENQGQTEAAIRAWNDYLKLDADSPWANEAREKIKRLMMPSVSTLWEEAQPRLERALRESDRATVTAIVSAFPQQTRMLGEDSLLECWATSTMHGNQDAHACLSSAKLIAEALKIRSGEALLYDTVATIERAPNPMALAAAHAAYASGRDAYKGQQYGEARREFELAQRHFANQHSPYIVMSRLFAAASTYYANDYEAARREIRSLLATFPSPTRYRAAYALAHWISGITYAFLGRLSEATSDYDVALDNFVAGGEQDNVLAMREMLASAYEMIGDRTQAWNMRYRAFADLAALGSGAFRRTQTIAGGARAAKAHGFTATALLLTEAEIASAERPDLKASAYARRALLSAAENDRDGAMHYALLADDTAKEIPNSALRDFATSDPDFVRAMCLRVKQEARLPLIEQAVDATERFGDELRRVELLLLLSDESIANGDGKYATDSLDRAVTVIDRQEKAVTNPEWCDALLDERRSVYRDLVSLLVSQGRTGDALVQAEHCRARTVRGGFERVAYVRTAADFARLRQAIPNRTMVVFFATAPERIFTWLLTSGSIQFFESPLPGEGTRALQRIETSRTNEDFESGVAEAGQWLIEPWLSAVPPDVKTIVFIPDDRTANVPFNAFGSGSGLLLDRFNVIVAPSVALYVACVERDRDLQKDPSRAMVVVAAADARHDLGIEALPSAANELRALRARSDVTVLEQGSATKRHFLEAAAGARFLHFTTHGLVNETRPSFSALVLQRDEEDDGLLYVHEIAKLQLPHTRMAVIAACGASRAGRVGREGTATIGRAFMAAGVPVVISSTRDVDDAIAAEIVASFYRRVDAGADPATALRLTQLSMRGRVAPVDWATMQVMGGIAETEREKWLAN